MKKNIQKRGEFLKLFENGTHLGAPIAPKKV